MLGQWRRHRPVIRTQRSHRRQCLGHHIRVTEYDTQEDTNKAESALRPEQQNSSPQSVKAQGYATQTCQPTSDLGSARKGRFPDPVPSRLWIYE